MSEITEKDIEFLAKKQHLTDEEKAIVRNYYRRMFLGSLSNQFFTVIEIGGGEQK